VRFRGYKIQNLTSVQGLPVDGQGLLFVLNVGQDLDYSVSPWIAVSGEQVPKVPSALQP
jgi:hypothetical protein